MPTNVTSSRMIHLSHIFGLLVCIQLMILCVNGNEGGDVEGAESYACHCSKASKVQGRSGVTSASITRRALQASLGNNPCYCHHRAQLHRQFLLSWLLPQSHQPAFLRHSLLQSNLSESHSSSSPGFHRLLTSAWTLRFGYDGQDALEKPWSLSYPARSLHALEESRALPPSASPATGQRDGKAPSPWANAPHIEVRVRSPSSGPVPAPLTLHRRHHERHQRHAYTKLAPPPVPGPTAASFPAHGQASSPPDCSTVVCTPPRIKAALLSECNCVQPIQVKIELSVPLYSLFPLISVLASELAVNIILSPRQVEIVGANVAGRNQEFSVVDANLVPLKQEFDRLTANLIFQKFWSHQITLNETLFGNYSVVYVHFPGLPPSPPSETSGGQFTGMSGIQKPFGVDVSSNKASHPRRLGIAAVAAIALASVVAFAICSLAVWFMLLKSSHGVTAHPGPGILPTKANKAGGGVLLLSSDRGSSISMSFPSSSVTYASTARIFSLGELSRATDDFAPENIIGEGGFGRVFHGILGDGTKVAVKVLTRNDDQGSKEFSAEVEMLSRLHHRNLVKLIGLCNEEHSRCLVYELIPNGSVESHLHGVDSRKLPLPLDWTTRMKIALGAARGLAYLHEDSNPRVIHRDFKAANILLENDFTAKVSDFGLAKVAPDGGSAHLSTRVMGTFGYVAPEYAMTGHLLVKSDVYSYGVVLLELLSGRKPVDMSQPCGQENLVTWARPLLTTMDGLQVLVDPALKDKVSFDDLAKVAAIASMCVHPEVSDRPFMGEVVQALKLVCNDADVNTGTGVSDNSVADMETGNAHHDHSHSETSDDVSFISTDYDSAGGSLRGERRPFSASRLFNTSTSFMQSHGRALKTHSLSGPLRPSRSKLAAYQACRQGSMSEHALFAGLQTVGLIAGHVACQATRSEESSLDFTLM